MAKFFQDVNHLLLDKNEKESYVMKDEFILKALNPEFKIGNIYMVNDLSEYLHIVNYYMTSWYMEKNIQKRQRYFFRGFSEWDQVRSKFYRNKGYLKNSECIETTLIRKFEENACVKIGQFNNPIDLVSAAQHYGVFTRLIDWSVSPFIATLFALHDMYKQDNKTKRNFYGVLVKSTRNIINLKSLAEKTPSITKSMSIRYLDMVEMFLKLLEAKSELTNKTLNSIREISHSNFAKIIGDTLCGNEKLLNEKIKGLSYITKQNLIFIMNYFNAILKDTNEMAVRYNSYSTCELMVRRFLLTSISIFVETNYSNERIKDQRGVFELDDIGSNRNSTKSDLIIISQKARNEIIKYINRIGISYYQITNSPQENASFINDVEMQRFSFEPQIEYARPIEKI